MKLAKSIKLMGLATISAVSLSGCKEKNANLDKPNSSGEFSREGNSQIEASQAGDPVQETPFHSAIMAYMRLKNALVASDAELSSKAGKELAAAISAVTLTSEGEHDLKDTINNIAMSATSISGSSLAEQRRHFEVISRNMIEMVKVAGTDQPLYQQFCPMYNENQGGGMAKQLGDY